MFKSGKLKKVYSEWVLVILWMGVIFLMSTDSFSFSKTSSYIIPLLQTLFPGLSIRTLHFIHVFLRKSGHFSEYAILSLLWYRTLQSGDKQWSTRSALLAFLLSAFYAATDEFHQTFVPSRGPSLIDVGIDTIGATCSLLVLRLYKS
ncbi:MAG: VanZ family protein [Nitrospiria bacterium]